MAIGLERVRGRTGSIVHDIGALVIAGLTLVGIVFGLVLAEIRCSPASRSAGRSSI